MKRWDSQPLALTSCSGAVSEQGLQAGVLQGIYRKPLSHQTSPRQVRGKWTLAVCKELGLVWHGAACSVMSTEATGSMGISKAITPSVNASK